MTPGRSTGHDSHVRFTGEAKRVGQFLRVIGAGAYRHDITTQHVYPSRKLNAQSVAHLAGRRYSRMDDFIAKDQHRNQRTSDHGDVVDSCCGQGPHQRWIDHVPSMRENITHDALLALHSNVLPVGDISIHSTIRHRRSFEGNNRCRSGGNSATGADPHRLSGIELHHTARAGVDRPDDGPRARAADHPPVHRRGGESGQIR